MKKKNLWKEHAYAVLIAFAVIAFWRGSWELMDI
ncbi:MAG: hypothetical protein ACI8Y7_001124 [Candidatus Woesearchaeota archaeon]|jgi:hypothetical protein